jgi:AcrR family transcriptional regulator
MREADGAGRAAQRRRTRKAIVDAAMALMAGGSTPSAGEIAAAAEVSRRTLYLHFPNLEQLLIDATVGAMSGRGVEEAIDAAGGDPVARVAALVDAVLRDAPEMLPLGRRLVRLTVEAGAEAAPGAGRRGYRRVGWIERAVEPLRARLAPERFERLVSALAVVIGWEALIVLEDVRGLDAAGQRDVLVWTVEAIVRAAMGEAG